MNRRFKAKYIPEENCEKLKKGFAPVNTVCARIIAADPMRYPGLPQEWAKMILDKAAPKPQGRLW